MDNPERITYFAATDSRGQQIPFGIKRKDRARHMYVIGKTGMGKSTLLENMAIQDLRNGEGLAFIDPHGSTAEKLLEYVPEHRIKDVVYFAPFDLNHPIAFNVMEDVGYDKRHLVTSGLMATFKKIWQDAWSARMEYILTNTLLALLEYPDSTLLSVNRMYIDKTFRAKVVDFVKDPVVKDFWTKEFAGYTDRFTQEATPAIQNKVGQFTSNPLIRNIIGQPRSSFDMRQMMDQKKILIINLSKGLVGDVNMRLLGSMLTTRIFLGAMSRAELSHRDLALVPPFFFYVDEFQNFANETFAEILSEARKYHLNLVMTHQYVEQMEEEVRDAVFGNVGTTISFRVGPFDAETLEPVFAPEFMKEDLVNLGFAQIYLTLMIDGVGSRPFSAKTMASIEPPVPNFKKEVVAMSRKLYATERAGIEASIVADLAAIEAVASKPPARKGPPRSDMSRPPMRSGPPPSERPREEWREQPPLERNDRPPIPALSSSQSPPPRERMERPAPPPEKGAEDLRTILKSMADKAKAQREKDEKKQETSLTKVVTKVVGEEVKKQIVPASEKASEKTEKNEESRAVEKSELPKTVTLKEVVQSAKEAPPKFPAPREAEPQAVPQPPVSPTSPDTPKAKEPFEVPEEKLREIFSEEGK